MKKRANYLTVTEFYRLNAACVPLWRAFPDGLGVYLVGSVLTRSDYRDVDIRVIVEDVEFGGLFPGDGVNSAYWLLVNRSISELLSKMTALDVDFQVQSMTEANKDPGERCAIGIL